MNVSFATSKIIVWPMLLFSPLAIKAQTDDFRKIYNSFKQQAINEYEGFRTEANRQYAEFMEQAWKKFKLMPAIPKPKDEDVKPVVVPKEEEDKKPIETKPLPIKEEVVTPPVIEPQPKPVAPIREQPKPTEKYVSFMYYGTELRVRFNDEERFQLKDLKNHTLAEMWKTLSDGRCDNTIRDCLEYRLTLQLSDWGYLMMLKELAEACLGKGNEAQLLLAYIYCQSGYKMRLAKDDNALYLFYASRHRIYNKAYYMNDGYCMYALADKDVVGVDFCDVPFPKEQPLSLYIPQQPQLACDMSEGRVLKSRRYDDFKVQTSVNKNLINFYNSYPSSEVNDNFMTRWQMYANTPMAKEVTDVLYPTFKEKLKGLSQLEAVERLLNWVQTAFVYEYDNKVWGGDHAFFAEESLYYPYCDCEDRSILFSHLVRDLLGLKVVLVYYPGHLATAVCFTDEVKGDYISLGNDRFVICDGTYIGARVGRTMPDMDNKSATVILLE